MLVSVHLPNCITDPNKTKALDSISKEAILLCILQSIKVPLLS